MTDVAIIDCGGANIASLVFAFERLQAKVTLTADVDVIRGASRVVLPGVGAAKDAMSRLTQAGLVEVIGELTQPLLGICLGMQLLATSSEEEDVKCLDIVPGIATKLSPSRTLSVPNMGWCRVSQSGSQELFAGIADDSYFYFVHSYVLPIAGFTIATAVHADPFTAVLARDNFYAAQFHPERSAEPGARFLQNFLSIAS
ncbi:MAG: imidazole glycerol phosphate synthase subunit HisH [Woeseiaceae bacterium]|nr:imidazole glycerol phosphate synthase subunit HisH [Woeseiaceae bacterium]